LREMDKKEFQVKMMFYIMAKGFEEIAKIDEEFQEDLEDIEGIVQWNIGNIRAYLKFDEGKYSFVMDAAYMSGDLKIEGNLQLTMTYGSLAEYLGDYLKFLRPEE
ncbi:MAG: hypothetical protein ACTSPS_11510, partial [Promethearchaeota archaeon]